MHRPAALSIFASLALLASALPLPVRAATKKAAPAAPAGTPAPVATYRIKAETSTVRSLQMPSMGQMMMGGSMKVTSETSRSLRLWLESSRKPASGPPEAEHRIPPGLELGSTLPLLSGQPDPGPAMPKEIPSFEPSAKARLLRFWGCGAQAGPGQPAVTELGLDRTKLAEAMKMMRSMPRGLPASSGTVGTWPAGAETRPIPLTASLVGNHTVVGNYSPEIRFSLGAAEDFLAPLSLKTAPEAGALQLSWGTVPNALAYGAQVVGIGKGTEKGALDLVIWESSSRPEGLTKTEAQLTPSVIARLVSQGELLAPDRTSCLMSVEARKAMEMPTSTLSAYGGVTTQQGPGWVMLLERTASAVAPPFESIDQIPNPEKKGGSGGGFNPFKLF